MTACRGYESRRGPGWKTAQGPGDPETSPVFIANNDLFSLGIGCFRLKTCLKRPKGRWPAGSCAWYGDKGAGHHGRPGSPHTDRRRQLFRLLRSRLYCLARRSRRFHAGTVHNRVHLRCRIYDCRRVPKSQHIGLFLAVGGESIYEGLAKKWLFYSCTRHHITFGVINTF
jgi:hypothetical protein